MEKNEGEAARRWSSLGERVMIDQQSCELDTPESIHDRSQLVNNIKQWTGGRP